MKRLKRLWRWMTQPRAAAEEEARHEYMTKVILLVYVMVSAVFAVVAVPAIALGWVLADTLGVLLGMVVFFSGGWWLAHQGRWRIAGYIPPLFTFLAGVYGNYVGGIDAPAMVLYALTIVLTIILQGRRSRVATLLACLAAYWLLGLGHVLHVPYLPVARTAGTVAVFGNRVIIVTATLISIMAAVWFLGSQYQLALNQARANAERVRGMFVASQDAIVFMDGAGHIQEANPAQLQMSGYRRKETLLGRPVFEFVAEADRAAVTAVMQQTLASGGSSGVHYRTCGPAGLEVEASLTLLRDEAGAPTGFVAISRDITERQRAAERLRESEEKYRQLFDLESDAIFLVDGEDGRILEANVAASTLYGYSRAELMQRRNVDLSAEPVETRRMMAERLTYAPIRWHCRKDGTVFPVEITARHIQWGGRAGYIAAIRDITERRRTENLLQLQRDLGLALNAARTLEEILRLCLHTAIEAARMDCGGVYSVDEQTGQLTLVCHTGLSAEYVHAVSYYWAGTPHVNLVTAGQPIYRRYTDLEVPPDETQQREGLRAVAILPVFHDGRLIACLNVASHIQDEVPAAAHAPLETIASQIGSAIARGKAAAALRESEQRFRDLVELLPQMVFETDAAGKFAFVNQQALKIFGYAEAEDWRVLGLNDIVAPEQADRLLIDPQALAQQAQPASGEYLLRRKDGSFFPALVYLTAIIRDGRAVGLRGLAVDITERKVAEEEIYLLNADLEQRVRERTQQYEIANRELESFSFSVSHDLRAPLRRIDGFAQALQEDYADRLDEAAAEHLGRIRGGAQHMGQLIDDLLMLSRVTRAELRRQTVDLSALAQGLLQELRQAEPHRPVEYQVAAGLRAQGDLPLLRVALANLLDNAWKFTSKNPAARIEVGAQTGVGGETVYYVRDNGAGFDMAHVDKLFGVFQRLHADEDFPGTGIGLATVQRIIHRHGGQIWAESALGEGTTLYFVLGLDK